MQAGVTYIHYNIAELLLVFIIIHSHYWQGGARYTSQVYKNQFVLSSLPQQLSPHMTLHANMLLTT